MAARLIRHILKTQKEINAGKVLSKRSARVMKLNSSRVLFIGMADSPHLRGWIAATKNELPELELFLFPSDRPRFDPIAGNSLSELRKDARVFTIVKNRKFNFAINFGLDLLFGIQWRAYFLARYIRKIKPEIIHFHETQHSAYIYNLIASSSSIPGNTRNLLSTWGSDFILYSKIASETVKIQSCLNWLDLITAERDLDERISRNLGYKGEFRSPVYITIGSKNTQVENIVIASKRKIVLVKGTQDNTGRSLNILAALQQLDLNLDGFEILVYSASEPTKVAVDLLRNENGLNIRCLPRVSKKEMKELFERARVSIGVGISDGLPGALVEAMGNGAFPIQSSTSCADVFIENGKNGFIVDVWDLEEIKSSIKRALLDDELVDQAATLNASKLEEIYSWEKGIERLKNLYK
jgi:glycosyltransferase involved in cell wall biosynthesis